jgi:hypothetical protein
MLNTQYREAFKVALKSLSLASCLLVNACAITPDSIVKQPMTAKPVANIPAKANNGAIFTASAYHPLFEDRRPRYVGDIVTLQKTQVLPKQVKAQAAKTVKRIIQSLVYLVILCQKQVLRVAQQTPLKIKQMKNLAMYSAALLPSPLWTYCQTAILP